MLQAERLVEVLLADQSKRKEVFPNAHIRRLGRQGGLQIPLADVAGAHQDLAQPAFVTVQGGPGRVAVFGLDPSQRPPPGPGGGITAQRPGRGQEVDRVRPEDAQRHAQSAPPAIEPRHAARTHCDAFQPQKERRREEETRGWAPGGSGQAPLATHVPAPQPGRQAVEQHRVGEQRDRVSNEAFTVPPEPVGLARTRFPAVPLPGLQRDARYPARPLLQRLPNAVREALARGYRLAADQPDGHESLWAAQTMQAEPGIVVFGERPGVEDSVTLKFGQFLQRPTRIARAHSVRRDEPPKELPRRNVPALVLGKLVAVDPLRDLPRRRGQGKHGDLHHPERPDVVVDPAQLLRMDQVFGVVQHHDVEPDSVPLLMDQHPLVDPVQAIGLRGRAVVGTESEMNVGKPRLGLAHCIRRQLVVGIGANEEVVVGVADGRQIVLEHLADDPVFAPQRDEHRDALFRRPPQFGIARRRDLRSAQEPAAEPVPGDDQVQEKVVQTADEDTHSQRGQQRRDTTI